MIICIYIYVWHFDLHLVVLLLVNVSVHTGMVHAISGYRLPCREKLLKWD